MSKGYDSTALATQSFVVNPAYAPAYPVATSPSLVYYGVFSGQVFRAIQEIEEISELPADWDKESGAPITRAATSLATTIVLSACRHGHRTPDIYPLNDGGILLEWRGISIQGRDLLLQTECLPGGSVEMSVTSEDDTYELYVEASGVTEFSLGSSFERVPVVRLFQAI